MLIALDIKPSFLPLQTIASSSESSLFTIHEKTVTIESFTITKKDISTKSFTKYFKQSPLTMSVETATAQIHNPFNDHSYLSANGVFAMNGTSDLNGTTEHKVANSLNAASSLNSNAASTSDIIKAAIIGSDEQPAEAHEDQAVETTEDAAPPTQDNLNGAPDADKVPQTVVTAGNETLTAKDTILTPALTPLPKEKPLFYTTPIPGATKLKRLLEETSDLIVCPGVYDGLSARVALEVGFNALYMVCHSRPLSRTFHKAKETFWSPTNPFAGTRWLTIWSI